MLANLAVTGLTKVIGSPFVDHFTDNGTGVAFEPGAEDTGIVTIGIGGIATTLDLFETGLTGSFDVDLASGEVLLDGAAFNSFAGAANVVSGRGNDTLHGSQHDNVFFFRTQAAASGAIEGWGIDTVTGGGGRNLLDFTGIPADWNWSTRTESHEGIDYTVIYVVDGSGVERPHQVRLPRAAVHDVTVRDRNGLYSGDQWQQVQRLLALDSLVTASPPPGVELESVPPAVVAAAMQALAGKIVQVPRTDGSGVDDFELRVIETDDGSGPPVTQLVTTTGNILLDARQLRFVVLDLPDRQLSTRLLGGEILIDTTAGDHGWHTDPTALPPAGKVDLASVVLYELAQRLRLDESIEVMQGVLPTGQARRTLPATIPQSATPFNDAPLEVSELPVGAIEQVDAAIDAVIDEAVNRWQTAAANLRVIGNSSASVTVVRPIVQVAHLPGHELARTLPNGSIVLDPTAAGHGWFIDGSPTTDDDIAAGSIDLLTIVMHEMGHALGFGHDAVAGETDLTDESIAPGVRINPPTGTIDILTLDSSDQSKLSLGLEAFGGWVADLGLRLDQMLTGTVDVPLLGGVSIAGLFGMQGDSAAKLTQGLQADILTHVAAVFGPGGDADGDGVITNLDIAAQPNIGFAPSTNAISYVATVGLSGLDFNRQFPLDFSALSLAGIDPATLGLSITSSNPPQLNVSGGIDLMFIFGLDSAGQFYVDAPQLVASLSVDSGPQPFDFTVSLGPFGLSVDQGHVELAGQMVLGTDARLTYQMLVDRTFDPLRLLPTLAGGARYDINLPLSLSGALSGLNRDGLAIRAAGEIPASFGSLETLIAGIELETPGLSDLLSIRQISLDQILDAIIAGLDSLAADGSVIYQKLPGVNQSAAELLGGGADLIQQLRGAVNSFRNGDLGSLEAGLNAKFNEILGPGTDPFRLEYEDSRLLMGLSFEKVVGGVEAAFAVDLADILDKLPIPPLKSGFDLQELIANNVDISLGDADGQIKLGVEGLVGVDLGFGFDFTNVLDPQTFIAAGSGVSVALEARTQSPVDFEVQLDLGEFGKVGFLIDDATARLRLDAGYGLADNEAGFYSFAEITADDLTASVQGRAAIDLPLFLTPQLPGRRDDGRQQCRRLWGQRAARRGRVRRRRARFRHCSAVPGPALQPGGAAERSGHRARWPGNDVRRTSVRPGRQVCPAQPAAGGGRAQ